MIFPVDYVTANYLEKHVPIIKILSIVDVTVKHQ